MAGQFVNTRPQFVTGEAPMRASTEVAQAIHSASRESGVGFKFLLASAAQESGLQANAQSRTSTASGLFQFTAPTWLQMVRDHGAKYGLAQEARQIATDPGGKVRVADPKARDHILALRANPKISAAMAAEYARANRSFLERKMGGPVGDTAVYLAHFLGPGGAAKLLTELRDHPNRSAADILPKAAAANPSVFHDRTTGAPRSVAQVYDWAFRRIDTRATALAAANPPAASQVTAAAAPDVPAPVTRKQPVAVFVNNSVPPDTMLALARMDLFNWRGRKGTGSG